MPPSTILLLSSSKNTEARRRRKRKKTKPTSKTMATISKVERLVSKDRIRTVCLITQVLRPISSAAHHKLKRSNPRQNLHLTQSLLVRHPLHIQIVPLQVARKTNPNHDHRRHTRPNIYHQRNHTGTTAFSMLSLEKMKLSLRTALFCSAHTAGW